MKEFIKGLFNKAPKKRIWELDAFRGICIIGVVIIHVLFDMREFFGLKFALPVWLEMVQRYGGILFIILSGICVTLGHHNIARGLIVAASALVITGVTVLVFDKSYWILFGVLHLLAFCMLTYSIYRRIPWPVILGLGLAFIALGYYFESLTVSNEYLFPLGLITKKFSAGDFFPIFPHLGFFMVGTVLGKTVYKNKETLFKKVNERFFLIRFLSFAGRHSLLIYLIHQPIAFGLFYAVRLLISAVSGA